MAAAGVGSGSDPAGWLNGGVPGMTLLSMRWWTRALAQNLDVAQAVLRLRQQRLLAGTADAAFRPIVSTGRGLCRILQQLIPLPCQH